MEETTFSLSKKYEEQNVEIQQMRLELEDQTNRSLRSGQMKTLGSPIGLPIWLLLKNTDQILFYPYSSFGEIYKNVNKRNN